MPVFYEHINGFTKIAIWRIAEEKNFFLEKVPLQREITHPHKQLQHLAGRYLLQYLYPDFPFHLIEIAPDSSRDRKPFLPNEAYHFSISHCGDYAAVIISKNNRVGIDIELVTEKVERIKHKFLNAEELNNIQHSTLDTQQLTLLWCCKEAVFKWYGNREVDFKNNIHLHLKNIDLNSGKIDCDFIKEEKTCLHLQFKFFDGLCLAWVIS